MFGYYTSEHFTQLLIEEKPMAVWCMSQGAVGIAASVFAIIFTLVGSQCGLILVCRTPTQSSPHAPHPAGSPCTQSICYDSIAVLSSLGMTAMNTIHVVMYMAASEAAVVPGLVLGVPAAMALLLIVLLITSSITAADQ